jgi:uncharacterized protein YcfL
MKVILLILTAFSFVACSSIKDVSKAKESAKLETTILHEGAF